MAERARRTGAVGEKPAKPSSIDESEVARFSALAQEWWNPAGRLSSLHRINPLRLAFIRQEALVNFGREGSARAPFEGLRLLDLGCGGGLVCEPMRRLGFEAAGWDASEEIIGIARAHAQEVGLVIPYRKGGVEDVLAQDPAPFDVILALEVIEHVEAPEAFIANCARLIAPGGLFLIATLNRTLRSLALAKIGAEYLLRWVPAGTHDWRKFLAPAELAAMLEGAGLTVGRSRGLRFDPMRGGWSETGDLSVNYMIAASRPNGPSKA
ncbi:MAG: bifunctional 2-polyprenyl-6-hydroxyphenol methylase/3-demethylubiquinol 3-O-methyltransferase UbiG [Caulobacteraceae bacterium]